MKSIIFFLKLITIFIAILAGWVFIEDLIYSQPDFLSFWSAALASYFAFQFHLSGKKYAWDDDYWYLLFKTGYKKYSTNIKNSKEKMRNELKDE